jgi:transporter family protein
MMMDTSIAFAICSLALYGFTQVIAKYAVGSLRAESMVAMNFLVSLPIYVFILAGALILWGEYLDHLEYVFYAIVGASTARGGYYIYLEALEEGTVSMVGSITAAFPAITAILAITLLGEDISWINGLGITVIIISMIGLSGSHNGDGLKSGFSRKSLVLSLTTLLVWGFGGIFIKMALDELPLIAYLGVYPLILPPIAFAYLHHRRAHLNILIPKWTVPVILAIVVAELWQLGYFAETSAISLGSASLIFPLISAYPIVTILGARAFLGERLTRMDFCLIMSVIAGIVMTSVP